MDAIRSQSSRAPLVDPFGRAITYLRVSVTDRCDFRCVYCMAEDMTFLPKQDLLTLEELDRLCSAFVARGVRKLRLTGGEPLVRRDIMALFRSLSRHLQVGRARRTDADHQRLAARPLRPRTRATAASSASMSRSTRSTRRSSARVTRWGDLAKVLAGIDAAQAAGLHVKINAVALKGVNEDEIPELMRWAHGRGMDLTLIEVMPLGDIERRPHRPVSAALGGARAARAALHARGHRLPAPAARRATCSVARDRRAARLHHAADA